MSDATNSQILEQLESIAGHLGIDQRRQRERAWTNELERLAGAYRRTRVDGLPDSAQGVAMMDLVAHAYNEGQEPLTARKRLDPYPDDVRPELKRIEVVLNREEESALLPEETRNEMEPFAEDFIDFLIDLLSDTFPSYRVYVRNGPSRSVEVCGGDAEWVKSMIDQGLEGPIWRAFIYENNRSRPPQLESVDEEQNEVSETV